MDAYTQVIQGAKKVAELVDQAMLVDIESGLDDREKVDTILAEALVRLDQVRKALSEELLGM